MEIKKYELAKKYIEELRKRLFIVAVFFVLAMIGAFFIAKPLIVYLQSTGEHYFGALHAFNVTAPLAIYFQVIFLIAMILSLPILLYQLWSFITPGLKDTERKATLSYIPYSVILFFSLTFIYYFFSYLELFSITFNKN